MKRIFVFFVLLSFVLVSCITITSTSSTTSSSSNTTDEPALEFEGTWTQGDYFTITISSDMITKLTYNEKTLETIFTGSRGNYSVDGNKITWTKNQNYSSSMDWYNSGEVVTVYMWSVVGDELTLSIDSDGDGEFESAVVWTSVK